jgi:hypothetical protein
MKKVVLVLASTLSLLGLVTFAHGFPVEMYVNARQKAQVYSCSPDNYEGYEISCVAGRIKIKSTPFDTKEVSISDKPEWEYLIPFVKAHPYKEAMEWYLNIIDTIQGINPSLWSSFPASIDYTEPGHLKQESREFIPGAYANVTMVERQTTTFVNLKIRPFLTRFKDREYMTALYDGYYRFLLKKDIIERIYSGKTDKGLKKSYECRTNTIQGLKTGISSYQITYSCEGGRIAVGDVQIVGTVPMGPIDLKQVRKYGETKAKERPLTGLADSNALAKLIEFIANDSNLVAGGKYSRWATSDVIQAIVYSIHVLYLGSEPQYLYGVFEAMDRSQ